MMDEPRMRTASPVVNSAEERINAGATSIANGAADVFVGAGYAARRTWSSKGLWAIGAACCLCGIPVVFGAFLNFGKGAAAGIARVPLPNNAPATMKFGAGTGVVARGVATGGTKAVGALIVNTSTSVAEGTVLQMAGDVQRPKQPQPVRYRRNNSVAALPVVNK